MINLPNGLFIIKNKSGISEKNVNHLIEIGGCLKRKIDIITDINGVDFSLSDDSWVRRVEMPDLKYDYIFIADEEKYSDKIYNETNSLKSKNGWIGYMIPISDSMIKYNIAQRIRNNFKYIGYDSIMIPNVLMNVGKEMFIIFNNLQNNKQDILSQSDSGDHKIIWGNIFRSCGFFNAKATLIKNEFRS